MECVDVRALAGNYLDGELPEAMCDRIQRHLFSCAGCRAEVDGVRMTVEVLKATHPAPSVREEWVRSSLQALCRELDIAPVAARVPGQLVLGIGAGAER
jgi:anti-sigma factor RsiW